MGTPQVLTQADIDQLGIYANTGTISGVLNYYDLLAGKGYDYATLGIEHFMPDILRPLAA